ncbi:MAG TPA: hypothetical protein PKA37_06720 [Planctomycetota bacterium]|nr:hypothetical protein [Planctomycetota bacterium]
MPHPISAIRGLKPTVMGIWMLLSGLCGAFIWHDDKVMTPVRTRNRAGRRLTQNRQGPAA